VIWRFGGIFIFWRAFLSNFVVKHCLLIIYKQLTNGGFLFEARQNLPNGNILKSSTSYYLLSGVKLRQRNEPENY
jgi:hypothetical protein